MARSRRRDGRSSRREPRHRDRKARSRSSRHKGRRRSSERRKRRKERSPETQYSSSSSSSSSGAKKKSADSDKDEIVHFSWSKGQKIGDKKEYARYQVRKLLGDGTFGRVLLCHDSKEDQEVAVKVIRDVRRYAENAKIEADILRDIKKADPNGKRTRSAIMLDTFLFNGHFCLVFEVCGCSLYDFLKENNFKGFWMEDIQQFAEQSLDALGFLHSRLQMTHTDLKPENILLAQHAPPQRSDFPREAAWQEKNKSSKNGHAYFRPVSSHIKLIDFGNATYEDEHHSSIINTRQYRGPEVILSMGWNELSDVWSMGCILMELYTGELLFGTHENLEHLALMEKSLGKMSSKMLSQATGTSRDKYLARDRHGDWRLNWPAGAQSASSERHVRNQLPLEKMVPPQHAIFAEFVGRLLTFDKNARPSAKQVLNHRFLKERNIPE